MRCMKIKEYSQMMGYLTRPTKSIDPRIVEKDLAQKQLEKLAVQPDSRGMFKKLVKANELADKKKRKEAEASMMKQVMNFSPNKIPNQTQEDYINEILHTYEDGELNKNNTNAIKKMKKNLKVASETPKEEADLLLGMEAEQFMKWLKKNKDKTYKDWLKDKRAFLTDEEKKNPKIIDLEPYLPTFKEQMDKMEKQEQQEENKESFNDNINRRAEALRMADLNGGVAGLFKKKLF